MPRAWVAPGAFPALQHLNLADNLLAGSLADLTRQGDGGGLLPTQLFNVSRNFFSQGPIPGGWASPTLRVLDVSYNQLPGELPAQWGEPRDGQRSAFPSLYLLAAQGNMLEGAPAARAARSLLCCSLFPLLCAAGVGCSAPPQTAVAPSLAPHKLPAAGPYNPWPQPGTALFAPNFTATMQPGNGLMEGVPDPPAAAATSTGGGGLSAGAVAGIVVGCVAGAGEAAGDLSSARSFVSATCMRMRRKPFSTRLLEMSVTSPPP